MSTQRRQEMSEKKRVRRFQKIGDNVYRISGTVKRDARTGRYIVNDDSSQNAKKDSTVNRDMY